MKIIPALYLSRGNAVSHYKGESVQETILSRDPLRSAREFEKQGARIIHLVDLDATDGGSRENQAMAKLIAKHTSLEVQYAEGIDSEEVMADLFEAGVWRISLNQFSQALLPGALARFGSDKILFTIRAERHIVVGRPGVEVMDYGRDLVSKGITQIIFRDTKAEGSFHPNYDEVERLIIGTSAKIFAFGGIGQMDDVEILEKTGASGVIISRAFFEGKLSLRKCTERFEQ